MKVAFAKAKLSLPRKFILMKVAFAKARLSLQRKFILMKVAFAKARLSLQRKLILLPIVHLQYFAGKCAHTLWRTLPLTPREELLGRFIFPRKGTGYVAALSLHA
jgi:hypothetical protein